MKGQVGYWAHSGGGVVVAFGDEMLRWLDRQDTERRVAIRIGQDGVLSVEATRSGPVVALTPKAHRDYTHQYRSIRSVGCTTTDGIKRASAVIEGELLPFGLTEVLFDETDDGLRCELPEECERAWPKLDPEADYGRPVSEVAEEVLQSRILALVASGQTSFRASDRPTDAFRRLLAPGAWAKCIATAKTLSGAK